MTMRVEKTGGARQSEGLFARSCSSRSDDVDRWLTRRWRTASEQWTHRTTASCMAGSFWVRMDFTLGKSSGWTEGQARASEASLETRPFALGSRSGAGCSECSSGHQRLAI